MYFILFTVDLTQALNNCGGTTGKMKGQENPGTPGRKTQIQWEGRGKDPLEGGMRGAAVLTKKAEVRKDKDKQRNRRKMPLQRKKTQSRRLLLNILGELWELFVCLFFKGKRV